MIQFRKGSRKLCIDLLAEQISDAINKKTDGCAILKIHTLAKPFAIFRFIRPINSIALTFFQSRQNPDYKS